MKKFFENTRKPTKSWGGKMMKEDHERGSLSSR